jgi:hypothetical protein
MSSEQCRHFIKLSRACPWCKREGFKEFAVVKAFQIYQCIFSDFLKPIADKVASPEAVVILAKDYSIGYHFLIEGNILEIEKMHAKLGEEIKKVKATHDQNTG